MPSFDTIPSAPMKSPSVLLLMLAAPTTRLAYHALNLAQIFVQQQQPFSVFFYHDAVSIANKNYWVAEDELNLRQAWQALNIPLPVCVSAALRRGILDQDNAKRHYGQHEQDTLASGFQLVGLATLVDALQTHDHVLQF